MQIKEEKVEDLQGKYDRSLLRKQKERALKQLEDEKEKVVKLEGKLALLETQNEQLTSAISQGMLSQCFECPPRKSGLNRGCDCNFKYLKLQ